MCRQIDRYDRNTPVQLINRRWMASSVMYFSRVIRVGSFNITISPARPRDVHFPVSHPQISTLTTIFAYI